MTDERMKELEAMDKWPQSRPELAEALREIRLLRVENRKLQATIDELRTELRSAKYEWR